jgi:hypothetical protein
VAGIVDWIHPRSIGGGGPAGEVTDERRRRSSGGAPAGTRTAVREGAGINHVLHGELPCDLGKALSSCLCSGNRQRCELDGGGRGNSGSSECVARLDQYAAWGGVVVHKEELRHLGERRRRPEEGSHRAAPMADDGDSGGGACARGMAGTRL